jgi:hypothetical protein
MQLYRWGMSQLIRSIIKIVFYAGALIQFAGKGSFSFLRNPAGKNKKAVILECIFSNSKIGVLNCQP